MLGAADLTRSSVGQIKTGGNDKNKTSNTVNASSEAFEKAEASRLLELKGEIEGLIDASELMKKFENQIILDITPEGLRIQIVDERNRPMFNSGSAVLNEYMKGHFEELDQVAEQGTRTN